MNAYISIPYQAFYVIIPTISLIGNGSIVYVTIRSRTLRSACNIFIALISLGDAVHMFAHFAMIVLYYISPNHLIRHDICVRWQLLPIFGMSFSIVLLFNVAVDRLMSLHRVYHGISNVYKCLYVGTQISIALAFSIFIVVLVYVSKRTDRQVACIMTAAMHGQVKELFMSGAALFMILILICYVLFLIKIKKVKIRDRNLKSVYRSLILISATVVFGWFATSALATVLSALNVDINDVDHTLLAGTFINLSMMSNFFIYYIVSQQYRDSFDNYLHSGVLRNIFGLEKPVRILPLASFTITIIRRTVT